LSTITKSLQRRLSSQQPKGRRSSLRATALDPRLKRLIELIFDKAQIVNTLKEIGYDSKKMPLGKLSKNTLNQGLAVLRRIESVLDGNSKEDLTGLSGEFASLIPHDFGFRHMSNFIIRTKPELKRKIDMIANLAEMKIASTLLSEGDEFEDPTLEHYSSLKCNLKPLDATESAYKLVTEYITNTHAPTHSSYRLKVLDIFEIDREGETDRYKSEIPNPMLLWHGGRLTNWVGILSQGLRIAPPEAPVSGYMFGKGVYFADMVSKSANYCFTNPTNNTGILMLCEVALGNMRELCTLTITLATSRQDFIALKAVAALLLLSRRTRSSME
jgi:poly [ADP-ribose] polymerase